MLVLALCHSLNKCEDVVEMIGKVYCGQWFVFAYCSTLHCLFWTERERERERRERERERERELPECVTGTERFVALNFRCLKTTSSDLF